MDKKETNSHMTGFSSMSDKEFLHLSRFIHDTCGIKMPHCKKVMLEARLQKRLRKLGLKNFKEYSDYLFNSTAQQKECVLMIDAVTTNKTDFYREPWHFDYLVKTVLPKLVNDYGVGIKKKLVLWSAGCSTGEEPYTLGMILSEFAETCHGFEFVILATDISTNVLEKAKTGIYEEEKVEPLPSTLKNRYLTRSKDREKKLVRIAPEIRRLVRFERLNLMDEKYGLNEKFDIIFCRNVIIYFDKETQVRLLNNICKYIVPGGYIFMGHSETLNGMNVPLVHVAPTIYLNRL